MRASVRDTHDGRVRFEVDSPIIVQLNIMRSGATIVNSDLNKQHDVVHYIVCDGKMLRLLVSLILS